MEQLKLNDLLSTWRVLIGTTFGTGLRIYWNKVLKVVDFEQIKNLLPIYLKDVRQVDGHVVKQVYVDVLAREVSLDRVEVEDFFCRGVQDWYGPIELTILLLLQNFSWAIYNWERKIDRPCKIISSGAMVIVDDLELTLCLNHYLDPFFL